MGQNANKIDYLKLYIIIFKIYVHKESETSIGYEELCRDFFGNEYYYLMNIDKLMNSVNILLLYSNLILNLIVSKMRN